ncbi:MAG: flagellar hook-basal body complex protein FliE [Planctomycetota bacterium]|jgi:flagellar hook-basal body complex protein FliE
MPDPVGLIGAINQDLPALTPKQTEGPGFKNLLQEQIDKVNQLQRDATEAMEDLATGGRDDVESVLIATQKADTAFRLLLQVRNKVLDAYEEVKQIRV